MTTTARHSYITWPEGTTQPQVGYNDLVDKLDVEVGLSVISRTTDAQPATPSEGDTYIITGSATGAAWSTYSEHDIAIYRSSAWTAITPIKGQLAHVQDESDAVIVWAGSAYVTVTTSTPLGKYDATTAPTVNEDSGDGYSVGSLWVDVTGDAAYVCLDASAGAAVWLQVQDAADLDAFAAVKTNLAASTAPGVGDDDGDGYGIGSLWLDTTADKAYICLDASTGAAVWTEITQSGASTSEFADNVFRIQDNGDATKELAFEVSGITTGTTRTVTMPDEDMSPTAAGVAFDGTKYVGVNNQTGTAYTLVLSDAGKLVTMSNAAANTLTIPANASVAFPIGTRIDVLQLGAGQTTVAITTDTLNGNTNIDAQYEVVSLIKITSTSWVIVGGVA